MTNPLFRHEVQLRFADGSWGTSALNEIHDGAFDDACAERDAAQQRNRDAEYRVMTALVPPVYGLQLRTCAGRWAQSAYTGETSWLGAVRRFQEAPRFNHHLQYRVVQVDA